MKNPTPKQRKAARAVAENLASDNPKTMGEIVEKVGYAPSIAKHPSRVTESEGFKVALRELGLTEDLITSSLVEDIKDKPKNRIQELKLGAELLGMTKREEEQETTKKGNIYNFFLNDEAKLKVREAEVAYREALTQPKNVQEN